MRLTFALGVMVLGAGCGSIALAPDAAAPTADGAAITAGDGAAVAAGDGPSLPASDGAASPKAGGEACGAAGECASGFCADGVCCNAACAGACVSCAQPGRVGVCWPAEIGAPDPHALCADEGAASCGTDGTCDGFGRCARRRAGTVCAASTCVGNAFEGARVCDGRGVCGAAPALRACAPYACNPASCLDACTSDLGCVAPAVCLGGACRVAPTLVLGVPSPSGELGGSYADPRAEDRCPVGSAVVGLDVATTGDPKFDVVVRVRTICGALRVTHAGQLGIGLGATTALVERGSAPGPVAQLRCPKDQVVVRLTGRGGAFVDQLGLECAPLLVATSEAAVDVGATTPVGPVGGAGGGAQGPIDCGPARVAVGARTLADAFFVETFGLLCAAVELR
jgi:hypothetical protein